MQTLYKYGRCTLDCTLLAIHLYVITIGDIAKDFFDKFVVNLILAPRNSQACFYSQHFNIPNLQLAKIGVQ